MPDDVNPALRAEIEAALVVIGPQIEGLNDLTRIKASDGFLTLAADQYNELVERERLLNNVISAMDVVNDAVEALAADGYPALPAVPIAADVAADVARQKAESDAAYALFAGGSTEAASMNVTLGAPSDKPSSTRR